MSKRTLHYDPKNDTYKQKEMKVCFNDRFPFLLPVFPMVESADSDCKPAMIK